jgi:hypothetical protein
MIGVGKGGDVAGNAIMAVLHFITQQEFPIDGTYDLMNGLISTFVRENSELFSETPFTDASTEALFACSTSRHSRFYRGIDEH